MVKSGPTSAQAGTTVTYTFTVTNIGDVDVNGVTVDDDIAGAALYQSGDTNTNDILETTETWIYTVSYAIPADQKADVVNTATACSFEYMQPRELLFLAVQEIVQEDEVRTPVCDTDTHTLSIPQVLGETTVVVPPAAAPALVNTGDSISALQYILPTLLIALAGIVTRYKSQTTSK